jgi:hypothetical protein
MKRLRDVQGQVDLTMSVCTGAFNSQSPVSSTENLRRLTTSITTSSPRRTRRLISRGVRFVDDGSIITAGGLTSGISAALHVIERYFDASYAARTAAYMEFVPTARPA